MLQGIFRVVFLCFLAIEIRTVQADEPLVSLALDDADMMVSRGDRRRWGWWKKVKKAVKKTVKKTFRWVKHYYYKTILRRYVSARRAASQAVCGVENTIKIALLRALEDVM